MRSRYKPHTLANEVRLKRTQHSGSFVLVEGPDDSRLYRRFIDPKQCHMALGFNKENVISAIGLLESTQVTGVLGVVDPDFDVLDGKNLTTSNLIRVDCHDVEATLVRSPALDAVVNELASLDKLSRFENQCGLPLRSRLIETARCLGYLRWNSQKNAWGLRFEGLHFSRFVDLRKLTIDPPKLCKELKNNSQNWSYSEAQLAAAGWPSSQLEDPWHLCCGHDLVELLTLAFRRTIGSQQNLTTDTVASALRLAYSNEDFARSSLFAAIRGWEGTTGFRVLTPNEQKL